MVACSLSVFALAGCRGDGAREGAQTFFELPSGVELGSLQKAFSPNLRRYAVRLGDRLIVDGAQSASEGVGQIMFSPHGKGLAYEQRTGTRWVVVRDGVAGESFDSVSQLHWSLDGQHLAYTGAKGTQIYAVVDSRSYGPFPSVDWSHIVAGGRPLIVVSQGPNGRQVIDGARKSAVYDQIGPLEFSADRKHYAFEAVRGGSYFIVHNGIESAPIETGPDPMGAGFALNADGQILARRGRRDGRDCVLVRGVCGDAVDRVTEITAGKTGEVAYAVVEKGRAFVVRAGKAGQKYDSVEHLVWSPDGKRLAFLARESPYTHVVVDGISSGPFDSAYPVLFSPDSKRYAFEARRSADQIMVVDGREQSPCSFHWGKAFSRVGRHFAFTCQGEIGRWRVFVDGKGSPELRWVHHELFFDDARKMLFYVAVDSSGRLKRIGQPYAP